METKLTQHEIPIRYSHYVNYGLIKSYNLFKETYPDEEPFVKVICTRRKKTRSDESMNWRSNWSAVIIDEKNERKEVSLDKKVIQVKKTEKIEKTKIVDENYAIQEKTKKTIIKEELVESFLENDVDVGEIVVDFQDREYSGELIINGSSVESKSELRQVVLIVDGNQDSFNKQDKVIKALIEYKDLQERVKNLSAMIELKESKISDLQSLNDHQRDEVESMKIRLLNMEIKTLKDEKEESQKSESTAKDVFYRKLKCMFPGKISSQDQICEEYIKLYRKIEKLKTLDNCLLGLKAFNWEVMKKEQGFLLALHDAILIMTNLIENKRINDEGDDDEDEDNDDFFYD